MKILQITPAYPPSLGGVEQHVRDISRALTRLGHEVTVVSADGNALPARERQDDVAIYRFTSLGYGVYRAPLGLATFLSRHVDRFDVVHAHNIHALPLLIAMPACGARAVVTPHYHGHGYNRLATFFHHFYTPLARATLRQVQGVVCVSASEGELVAERLGVCRSDIAVVPNIVEQVCPPSAPDAAARPKDVPGRLVLSVGRLEPYKRIDRAIAALAHLPNDVRLTVAGAGPARAALERQAADLGLAGRVLFVGRVSDDELAQWYSRASVVVSFSEGEAFGRTVVEALSHGCRVVGNDLPAYQEFAAAYPEAITLLPASVGAAADAAALLALVSRPGSVSVDLHRFSAAAVAQQLVDIYAQVVRRRQQTLAHSA